MNKKKVPEKYTIRETTIQKLEVEQMNNESVLLIFSNRQQIEKTITKMHSMPVGAESNESLDDVKKSKMA